jgi:hypothetical protein
LFVGREACWLKGGNYIETVCKSIQSDDFNGWKVNQYPFHKRQFYIAYGIIKFVETGYFPKWQDVPWASDMAKMIFAKETQSPSENIGGLSSISWAFINLSKISNNTGDWRVGEAYHTFINDQQNQRFIREQIEVLAPRIIIGANVPELVQILNYSFSDKDNEDCHYYGPNGKFPHFMNCWHFSAIKSDKNVFYDPIVDVVQKHCGDLRHSD